MIQSQAELEALFARLRGVPLLAVDTEAASFHRFTDRVYLLQISSREETAVVDPLAVENLAPLGRVLADPAVETVFHDADYDLRLLDREYGYHASSLFDTRIAAQLLNEPGVGLAALLEKFERANRVPFDALASLVDDTEARTSIGDTALAGSVEQLGGMTLVAEDVFALLLLYGQLVAGLGVARVA